MSKNYDFGGYATKHNLRCSDGRIIRPGAFADMDGQTVPLVWHHTRDEPANVLGHALLENRPDGVYAYGTFNKNPAAKDAKELVEHKDIDSLSIYANQLRQKSSEVMHGIIREVSLVIAGANPGAKIDNLAFEHSDGTVVTADEEAIITSGDVLDLFVELQHDDKNQNETNQEDHMEDEELTIGDILEDMDENQLAAVAALLEYAGDDEDDDYDDDVEHSMEGYGMDFVRHNVFEDGGATDNTNYLTHDDMKQVIMDGKSMGSMKAAALEHGITNVDYLFPDPKTLSATPEKIMRPMEWVSKVFGGTRKVPFSRIKSVAANLTQDEMRARGYIKGDKKVEAQVVALKRSTTPTTVYIKQKMDRDDVLDIIDFDVIAWLKADMRVMLDEELAQAVIIGDGRSASDDDKINEQNVRPIWTDDEVYAVHIQIEVKNPNNPSQAATMKIIDEIVRSKKFYRGSGSPACHIGTDLLANMSLLRDNTNQRMYKSDAELAKDCRVSEMVEIGLMDGKKRTVEGVERTLAAIIVNMRDYAVGADKGGEVNLFDDFDIDFNQQKYLMETRISGALTKPAAAIVIELVAGADPVYPVQIEDVTTPVLP